MKAFVDPLTEDALTEDALTEDKGALRRAMRERLAGVPPDARARAAADVVRPLLAFVGSAPLVAVFGSMQDELDTSPLDDALRTRGIARAVPQVVGPDLRFRVVPASVRTADLPRLAFGVPAPTVDFVEVPLASCAAVIVPGLAFDAAGGRCGYGRGFYDRALVGVDLERCVGLGYDLQVIDDVPMGPADVRLRWLCTPSRGVVRSATRAP